LPLGNAPDFAVDWPALDALLDGPKVVILGHPNNPTGKLLDVNAFEKLRQLHPESLFVVDEAFADFCDDSTFHPEEANLLVLRSLTKSFAIAGLRLGFALGSPQLIGRLRERLPPWSVNLLAQRVGVRLFEDGAFLPSMRSALRPLKAELLQRLQTLPGCRVLDTAANWLLLELTEGRLRATDVVDACRNLGLCLRACDDFVGLSGEWLRISVRNEAENLKLVETLEYVLGHRPSSPPKRRARAIMLQGTSSDAGKSLLVTALCRCLAQDGYRVAPFKAQNMSNNSGIAEDGGEVGRAQIVQAWAAGLKPDTRMNPVLLKPSSDRGCQVVLRGHPIGHHDVLEYVGTKQRCLQAALDAYDDLAQEYDVIVCEGAGSAGEMNLRHNDIVNMGFVEHRDMPVLLVGDIDRGGVYASFVGHLEVMSEADRARVRGFLVNRFRGDPSLLADAHHAVERHTGRPVLGVVSYLKDLALPDEDRLSLESGQRCFGRVDAPLRIAVAVPPHVSNATDIDPLTLEDDVYLYLVERAEQLGQPDVILMLGTKNTVGDRLGGRHRPRARPRRGSDRDLRWPSDARRNHRRSRRHRDVGATSAGPLPAFLVHAILRRETIANVSGQTPTER
jgi:dethiobiotin synthetase